MGGYLLELKQVLLDRGLVDVAKLWGNLPLSTQFARDIHTILSLCEESAKHLSEDVYILYQQLVKVEVVNDAYRDIITRDLTTILAGIINDSEHESIRYISKEEGTEAILRYQQAIESNASAQVKLGHFYKSIGRDSWAFDWFISAANLGDADAMYWLGNDYFVGKTVIHDLEKAYNYYKKAAEKGHGDALNNYADMYLRGEHVDKDEVKALQFFKQAAAKGVPEAMYTLGYMYENGVGTKIDTVKSRQWFIESAHYGDDFAANRLGHEAIETGNSTEALTWYQVAADRGDSYGEYNLGHCYENGIGTQVNIKKAKYWYRKAAVKGDQQAKVKLNSL